MALAILVDIKEEVTCPICLELLTEPQSLDCGHSFCQSCITANHTKPTVGQEGESCCPVCRVSYQPGSLRPNRHLANIVEKLRVANLSPEEGQKVDCCARHGEKLLLFCKQDGKVICWLCERSQEHRDHQTFLLEEVAQEYQEKLRVTLDELMKKQQTIEKWKVDIHEERTSWKNQTQQDKKAVQAEFARLRSIVDSEEQTELQKLEKEEGDVLHSLKESENELAQQSQVVKDLISDLEHRLEGSAIEMLQDANDIMKRNEILILNKPKMFPKKKRVFRAPDLKRNAESIQRDEKSPVRLGRRFPSVSPSTVVNPAVLVDSSWAVSPSSCLQGPEASSTLTHFCAELLAWVQFMHPSSSAPWIFRVRTR